MEDSKGKGNRKGKGKGKLTAMEKEKPITVIEDGPGCGVNPRSKPYEYMKLIYDELDPQNRDRFRKSCFRNFLDLPDLEFQGQLIYKLVESISPESIDKRRMSFILNSHEFELGPQEYHIITGLSFKGWHKPPERFDFYDEMFREQ